MVRVLGETRRGSDSAGSWEAQLAAPSATLVGMVEGYGAYHEQSRAPVVRRELPEPRLVLVLSLASGLSLSRGCRSLSPDGPSAALVGVGQQPIVARHHGSQTVLEVRLSPLSAECLFGVPAGQLADQVVDLAELWGKGAIELVERAVVATVAERFDLVDDALAAHAEEGRPVDPVMQGVWNQLVDGQGAVTMGALREQTGWSERRLACMFREQSGLPPKVMSRLVRFQHAVALLRRPGHRSLASVALTCGYYDQAHLSREFRELADETPTEFMAGLRADTAGAEMATDVVVAPPDTNVQDGT
ncbi:helix-turn-helix domain-containing protein [Nocardia sp. NPDC050175]|uniref:AraC family transcriptional regulator n=1 Tax=Nocardia sp. NPDC050175 TaxID=3364317 RepID=UPI00378AE4AB